MSLLASVAIYATGAEAGSSETLPSRQVCTGVMSRDDDGSYYLDKGPGWCGGAALINDEYMSSHLEDRVRKATKITKLKP